MPELENSTVAKGLKGIRAADSSICLVNGTEGQLLYRGYDVDDLAEHGSFEEVAYLLLKGGLPSREEADAFAAELVDNRRLSEPLRQFIVGLPQDVMPMSALRTAISVAGVYDDHAEEEGLDRIFQTAIRLTAQMATVTAAIHRVRSGQEPVDPDPALGFAANYLYMLNGEKPSADAARAMDLILILHAEHGFNASTFAARVIIATLTDIYSAVTGAIGALKGKLHGGANTQVLHTLQQLGSADRVAEWVESVRASKGKFMGFGHAVYQTEDPRAKHLKELSRRLGQEQGDTRWYDISVEIERLVTQAINKHCNVDFYSASLQHYLGIPAELFTCVFAASRIAGWCAHILEQLADNKIIRPSANYVGPAPRPYVPIDER